MERIRAVGERMNALYLLGLLLFNPPLLLLFDVGADVTVFGVPLLFLYLFGSWGGLIVLTAYLAGRRAPPPPPRKT